MARRSAAFGFTLVEAMITIALFALTASVVMVSVSAGRGHLRESAGKLTGTIRAAYDHAALSGQTFRLVFSFDKNKIEVESADALLSFDEDQNPITRGLQYGQQKPTSVFDAALSAAQNADKEAASQTNADRVDDNEKDEEVQSALAGFIGLAKEAQNDAAKAFSPTEFGFELSSGVKIMDVWIAGMNTPAQKGDVYLYFFPAGFTQDAMINLTDADGAVFSVRVRGLTAGVDVESAYREATK
jgi:type II secretory pathway pseudopilin PulG